MRAHILVAVAAFLIPYYVGGKANAGSSGDIMAIHDLQERYAKAVDTVDLKLLGKIWSHSPEVSFIYPLGEEQGFDAIEQHVFKNVIGGMFSARDLEMHDLTIHVNVDTPPPEGGGFFPASTRNAGFRPELCRTTPANNKRTLQATKPSPYIPARWIETLLFSRRARRVQGAVYLLGETVKSWAFPPGLTGSTGRYSPATRQPSR